MPRKTMTHEELEAYLDELERLPRFDLSPSEAAPVLGCDNYSLNVSAKEGKPFCGIAYYFAGQNLRLSKAGVLAFAGRRMSGPEVTRKC